MDIIQYMYIGLMNFQRKQEYSKGGGGGGANDNYLKYNPAMHATNTYIYIELIVM